MHGIVVDLKASTSPPLYRSGQVELDLARRELRVLGVPVPRPTDLAFGGPGLRTLYVTSARDALAGEILAAAPLSGRMFELDAGVAGVPQPFAA